MGLSLEGKDFEFLNTVHQYNCQIIKDRSSLIRKYIVFTLSNYNFPPI